MRSHPACAGVTIRRVLAVPDLHFPFHCADALKALYSAARKIKPDAIVQLGDLYDFFSFSRFPKKPGVIHPADEIEEAYECALDFWRTMHSIAPKASLYQLAGNHCARPLKLTTERCPELYPLVEKSWKNLFKFDGVTSIIDTRDDLELDGVIYEHGFYSKPGQHMLENMRPTVIGHTHRPWYIAESIRGGRMLWELNCGYVANPAHPALNYPRKKWVKWVQGYGLISKDGPRFIPLAG